MLLQEHKKYHEMGAQEAQLKEKTTVHVVRTTNQTGEQFHVEVPIYPTDDREAIKNRVNFFLSIIQDRMEDENKAMVDAQKKEYEKRALQEASQRNNQSFINQSKDLAKKLKQNKIKQLEHDTQLAKLKENLVTANKELDLQAEKIGE